MLDGKTLSVIRDFAYNNSEKDDIHGFLHVERVYNLCLKLGKKLKAQLIVLQIAALLHDIGRTHQKNITNNKQNHAELSAKIASNFLQSSEFEFSKEVITNIIHCIKSHSFSNRSTPQSLEAKILSDADKLDALGAIGLYRTIGFTIQNHGGVDQIIQHLENKIMKLKNVLLLDISRKIAEERQEIILDFYNKIKKERIS